MEKIFLIGVVCVILISIAIVDARKKKIPNILLGIQTVDKVPDRSPGFSFIKFSTFLTFFHRFTKKNGSVINFIFQGFSSTS